jgi:hypothetical protein
MLIERDADEIAIPVSIRGIPGGRDKIDADTALPLG